MGCWWPPISPCGEGDLKWGFVIPYPNWGDGDPPSPSLPLWVVCAVELSRLRSADRHVLRWCNREECLWWCWLYGERHGNFAPRVRINNISKELLAVWCLLKFENHRFDCSGSGCKLC